MRHFGHLPEATKVVFAYPENVQIFSG